MPNKVILLAGVSCTGKSYTAKKLKEDNNSITTASSDKMIIHIVSTLLNKDIRDKKLFSRGVGGMMWEKEIKEKGLFEDCKQIFKEKHEEVINQNEKEFVLFEGYIYIHSRYREMLPFDYKVCRLIPKREIFNRNVLQRGYRPSRALYDRCCNLWESSSFDEYVKIVRNIDDVKKELK